MTTTNLDQAEEYADHQWQAEADDHGIDTEDDGFPERVSLPSGVVCDKYQVDEDGEAAHYAGNTEMDGPNRALAAHPTSWAKVESTHCTIYGE